MVIPKKIAFTMRAASNIFTVNKLENNARMAG
jgi:hypothetical protein